MAREEGDETLIKFGLNVLTLAVLAILTTAPIGALGIGLAGPRLLARQVKGQHTHVTMVAANAAPQLKLQQCEDLTTCVNYFSFSPRKNIKK